MYTELPKNSEYARRKYAGAVSLLAQSGFSPQLLLWNCGFNPAKPHYETEYNRVELDAK